MPRVSVVIPAFNASAHIDAALRSAFAQTYRDFEVIVVDDGSDDQPELLRVLHQWTGAVHYVRQENSGPARARNVGVSHASGEFVAFLDADDEWLPEKLARQVEYFDRYPATGLLHTGVIDERGAKARPGPPQNAFCDLFHTRFFINTLTVMVPRRILEATGGFDERREVHIEDWDLWLRIAVDHPLGYLAEPLALHRPGGWMSRQIERTYAAQLLVTEKNMALCARACAASRTAPDTCRASRLHVLHRDWGYDRLQNGNATGAREQFAQALTHAPWDLLTRTLHAYTYVPERYRHQARSVRRRVRRGEDAATEAPGQLAARQGVSLVHDTFYRRLRAGTIAQLHSVDDFVSRRSRSKTRIMFEAVSPMSFAVFAPIYERIRRDPRLELWFTAHGSVWLPEEIYGPLGIRERVVSASQAAGMKVDAYINADLWDMTWLRRRTRRIHLFHGVAGKYGLDAPVDLAPTIAAFDSLFFANADRRQRYIDAAIIPDEEVKAALIGYPKTDRLVDGSIDRLQVMSDLGLDPTVGTVIYAPTWSPYSSLNAMGEEVIDRLAAEGLQVIVKLHDRSYDLRERGGGGIDWRQRLAKYRAHPRIRVVTDGDGAPYMVPADVMVTDHSSIGFEFMLLDRPLIVIDRPELLTQAAVSADKVQRLRAGANVVASAAAVAQTVQHVLQEPERLSEARRRIAADLFYRPGTATDRAVALLYRLIELPEPARQIASIEPTRGLAALS